MDVIEGPCPTSGSVDYGCSCSADGCPGWRLETVSHFDTAAHPLSSLLSTNIGGSAKSNLATPRHQISSGVNPLHYDIDYDSTNWGNTVDVAATSGDSAVAMNAVADPGILTCWIGAPFPHGSTNTGLINTKGNVK